MITRLMSLSSTSDSLSENQKRLMHLAISVSKQFLILNKIASYKSVSPLIEKFDNQIATVLSDLFKPHALAREKAVFEQESKMYAQEVQHLESLSYDAHNERTKHVIQLSTTILRLLFHVRSIGIYPEFPADAPEEFKQVQRELINELKKSQIKIQEELKQLINIISEVNQFIPKQLNRLDDFFSRVKHKEHSNRSLSDLQEHSSEADQRLSAIKLLQSRATALTFHQRHAELGEKARRILVDEESQLTYNRLASLRREMDIQQKELAYSLKNISSPRAYYEKTGALRNAFETQIQEFEFFHNAIDEDIASFKSNDPYHDLNNLESMLQNLKNGHTEFSDYDLPTDADPLLLDAYETYIKTLAKLNAAKFYESFSSERNTSENKTRFLALQSEMKELKVSLVNKRDIYIPLAFDKRNARLREFTPLKELISSQLDHITMNPLFKSDLLSYNILDSAGNQAIIFGTKLEEYAALCDPLAQQEIKFGTLVEYHHRSKVAIDIDYHSISSSLNAISGSTSSTVEGYAELQHLSADIDRQLAEHTLNYPDVGELTYDKLEAPVKSIDSIKTSFTKLKADYKAFVSRLIEDVRKDKSRPLTAEEQMISLIHLCDTYAEYVEQKLVEECKYPLHDFTKVNTDTRTACNKVLRDGGNSMTNQDKLLLKYNVINNLKDKLLFKDKSGAKDSDSAKLDRIEMFKHELFAVPRYGTKRTNYFNVLGLNRDSGFVSFLKGVAVVTTFGIALLFIYQSRGADTANAISSILNETHRCTAPAA